MRNLLFIGLYLFLTACSSTTTLYIVRHAEKQTPSGTMMGSDVDLTAAGQARALILADSLAGKRVTAVYATPYKRTQQTVQPVADAKRLPVRIYPANQPASNALVDSLSLQKGKTFVVAGHSNTVPDMIRHLGFSLPFVGNIPEDDYDNLFKITFDKKGKLLEMKTYGPVSPGM